MVMSPLTDWNGKSKRKKNLWKVFHLLQEISIWSVHSIIMHFSLLIDQKFWLIFGKCPQIPLYARGSFVSNSFKCSCKRITLHGTGPQAEGRGGGGGEETVESVEIVQMTRVAFLCCSPCLRIPSFWSPQLKVGCWLVEHFNQWLHVYECLDGIFTCKLTVAIQVNTHGQLELSCDAVDTLFMYFL